ncbi:MAG: DUF1080 domain-containing protein [Akkermansiaceae bacterium]|nr:DUF1080 domain-containing protein [Akkermansiaceae bacterium]
MKYLLIAIALLLILPLQARQRDPNRNRSESVTWTDPTKAAKENRDFLIQGEYYKEGADYGVQVVALGDGNFEAYVLKGGLPGAGWERGDPREQLKGGKAKGGYYLSSTKSKAMIWIREVSPKVSKNGFALTLQLAGETEITLPRIERKSPTLGANPPEGAVVLFDGNSAEAWKNGEMEDGLLKAGTFSKEKFKSYTAHIEFRTPFKPEARGQGRGNSGVYHHGRWETQILDSFGLSGKDNQCGGIYSITEPRLNMCLPPLSWQTYDVDFTAAKFDENGKRTAWPRITVKLNGVIIHDDVELKKDKTAASPMKGPIANEPGPIFLQDHKNPVYFRNIWVVPK